MDTFNDFCKWAGNQRAAAEKLGVSEATVSRWASRGCVPSVVVAERVQSVSGGRFHWTQMMRPAPADKAAA